MQSRDDQQTRDYIGASIIGSDCLRQIWYEYNGFKGVDVPPKTKRTWAIGKILETLILFWLAEAGLHTEEERVDLHAEGMDFFRGHVDSILIEDGKTVAIIEVKTAKNSSFNNFVNKGVKAWNPQYYAQVQSYMGMSRIHSAYIIVLNKDSSDLADELVLFDEEFYESLKQKAWMIHNAKSEPPRVNSSPVWYQCKLCKFNKVCHK